MREIGVRELKASLSEVLRSVGRGEQIRVTLRGKPLADIMPAGRPRTDPRIAALVAEGRLTPRTRPLPKTPPPLAPARKSASDLVLAEREDER
jgi:prevent-host-death family protein